MEIYKTKPTNFYHAFNNIQQPQHTQKQKKLKQNRMHYSYCIYYYNYPLRSIIIMEHISVHLYLVHSVFNNTKKKDSNIVFIQNQIKLNKHDLQCRNDTRNYTIV